MPPKCSLHSRIILITSFLSLNTMYFRACSYGTKSQILATILLFFQPKNLNRYQFSHSLLTRQSLSLEYLKIVLSENIMYMGGTNSAEFYFTESFMTFLGPKIIR